MIKSDKKLKNLRSLLSKDDDLIAAGAIEMLREEEPFEGAVSLLADHYESTTSHSVRTAIEGFMNDIKDPSVRPEVVAAITKKREPGTVTMLVSSCWQSGMDYSKYAFDFAEIFLNSDVAVSVECYTVLEESIPQLEADERKKIVELLRNSDIAESTKKSLAADLLAMLDA